MIRPSMPSAATHCPGAAAREPIKANEKNLQLGPFNPITSTQSAGPEQPDQNHDLTTGDPEKSLEDDELALGITTSPSVFTKNME